MWGLSKINHQFKLWEYYILRQIPARIGCYTRYVLIVNNVNANTLIINKRNRVDFDLFNS